MQRKDIILEWIFSLHQQSETLKTYVEKVSDLILKGKLRLHQLTGIDPSRPLTNEEISSLWAENEYWQRACSDFWGAMKNTYPKSEMVNKKNHLGPSSHCTGNTHLWRPMFYTENRKGRLQNKKLK